MKSPASMRFWFGLDNYQSEYKQRFSYPQTEGQQTGPKKTQVTEDLDEALDSEEVSAVRIQQKTILNLVEVES